MISRRLLLNRLKVVAPAVESLTLNPVLTYVCFSGTHLIAFNKRIAISTPRTSEFKGCIPAEVLIDLLRQSRAAVVELEADGSEVVVKLGSARFRLPMLPLDEFTDLLADDLTTSAMPQRNDIDGIAGRFFAGIEHCLLAVETHSTVADRLGITVIPEPSRLSLYATTGITLARAVLPLPSGGALKQRCILSFQFCTAMLRLAKQATVFRFALNPNYAWFAAGDTLLYGKLLITEHPIEYQRVMAAHLPEHYAEQLVAIPHRRLGGMLQRALRIASVVGSEPYTEIKVKDEQVTLRVRSVRGELEDTLRLPGHPDVGTALLISNLCEGFAAFEQILFTEKAVILARGNLLRMISATPLLPYLRREREREVARARSEREIEE